MNSLVKFTATWGYLGRLPKAPGTWGSLGALPFVLLMMHLGPLTYLTTTFMFTLVALWVCIAYENQAPNHDAEEVVIDEVAGVFITMAWLPMTWQSFVFGFFLFRLLDILKPYPISWIDKKVQGGLGVLADDILAGVFSNIILQVIYNKTSWLGVQLVQ
ncbi:MAG: phosphatidylglycerophosphatase A [Bdellovibrionales bacterium]|nr:phosphatidylglycerophosphatase A [Bdellovibrionales bacterium]